MTTRNNGVFACLKHRTVSWWPLEPLIPSYNLGRAHREHSGRQPQHYQHGTSLELMVDGASPAHICQNLSPARKQLPFLSDCFLLIGEGRWCSPLLGQPFPQAVGAFERQTATERLWRQEETFSSLQAPAETLVLSAVQAVSKLSPHADMNVITLSGEVP